MFVQDPDKQVASFVVELNRHDLSISEDLLTVRYKIHADPLYPA